MKVEYLILHLPEELIAQVPLEDRTSSRLMVLDKKTGRLSMKRLKILLAICVKATVLY